MQYTLMTTTALVLFSTLAVAYSTDVPVPQPTNVTLQCHNFRNTLYWNYSQPSLESLRFRVDVGRTEGFLEPLWVKPPYLSCDLSLLCDTSECYSSQVFLVNVTAVVGEPEPDSTPEDGWTFSYFNEAVDVQTICKLDLPPVNVSVPKDGSINFSFSHPSQVYDPVKEEDPVKKRRKKKHQGSQNLFKYTVQTKGQKKGEAEELFCSGEVCTGKVNVHGSPESHCVEINGYWDGIAVQATQEYCAYTGAPADTTNQMLASILCPVALVCIVVIGCMVCRHLTKPDPDSSKSPRSLMFRRQETVETQVVESPTTPTVPLLPHVHDVVFITETEVHFDTPVQDEGVSSVLEDGQGDSVVGSCYNSGGGLDEEEVDNEGGSGCPEGYESRSAYEGRARLTVELSPGEEVDAYRGDSAPLTR